MAFARILAASSTYEGNHLYLSTHAGRHALAVYDTDNPHHTHQYHALRTPSARPLVWSWLFTFKNFVLALLAHACDVELFARKIIAEMFRPADWSVAPRYLAFVDSFRLPP